MGLSGDLLCILICPVCKGGILKEDNKVQCVSCGRRYPVKGGIPVMLAEEAEEGGDQRPCFKLKEPETGNKGD